MLIIAFVIGVVICCLTLVHEVEQLRIKFFELNWKLMSAETRIEQLEGEGDEHENVI